MKNLIVRSTYASIAVSTILTAAATSWDWLKNPSGIFHNELGTDWRIVFDTAVSWFFPSLLITFVVITLVAISLRFVRNSNRRRRSKEVKPKKKHQEKKSPSEPV